MSTDSVGKAGDGAVRFPCAARLCEVAHDSDDFVGDGRAVGLRPEPLRVSAYRLPSLSQRPLQHPCASAPVPNTNGRPGAQRQAESPPSATGPHPIQRPHAGEATPLRGANGALLRMVRVRLAACESAGRFSSVGRARDFLRLSGSG
ncbi:hypothetical protein THI_2056 [Thiomonas arsenitoxydans]|uniref:Uncharacterized protein n=1 Tax=Thiomonas arsenitoxydans (strain DSM 22701 / CIP 110005 / 3As) TaxID=426114 RepID=D6CTU4_THIA3|nr:hypothetical protein THI_2056 [Thiomonas arsenitoxydans]